jgi:2-polyprenyl-3-methyl-5-hydroxy-6-metoxy-1,4-benzoquinol methylase
MKKKTQINGILSPYLQHIRFKKALPYIVGNRIVDIGCSQGEVLKYLSKEVDYIGIEGNPIYFSLAKKINPQYTFINLYIDGDNSHNLNIQERDTILMLAILEHLNKPLKTLTNLKTYLSQNGRIIITTPTNYSKYILKIGSKLKMFTSEVREHKNHFTKNELLYFCRNANLKIIHYSRFEFGMNQLLVLKK